MTIHFERAVPILRIFSLEKAREFYLGFLDPFNNRITFGERTDGV